MKVSFPSQFLYFCGLYATSFYGLNQLQRRISDVFYIFAGNKDKYDSISGICDQRKSFRRSHARAYFSNHLRPGFNSTFKFYCSHNSRRGASCITDPGWSVFKPTSNGRRFQQNAKDQMLLMCMRLESFWMVNWKMLQRLFFVIVFSWWQITKDPRLPWKGELWIPIMRGSAFKLVYKNL